MIEQNNSLMLLLKQLQQVPYLASKNLYRVAHYFLDLDELKAEHFCKILLEAKRNLEKCTICWIWKEKQKECIFCFSSKRDKNLVCVVESWHDVLILERTGAYQGLYHVLGGLICPLDGIGPEDLTIASLVMRVSQDIKEIIFAFNQTPEGEATSAYIASKLKDKPIKVSRLARGLSVGSSLEAADRLTVYKALFERQPF